MKTLFNVVIIASSLFLIISIVLQPSNPEGMGSITGGTADVWGKNKDRSIGGTLQRLTAISAAVFMISALVLAAMQ
ncbi:MAG TPA: preprotein translocase subunit SecG [Tissierellales bacterium]|nr:preprotein translocase subunit SecG [Tissierellales bacterium]